jgi:hypothetical protein
MKVIFVKERKRDFGWNNNKKLKLSFSFHAKSKLREKLKSENKLQILPNIY